MPDASTAVTHMGEGRQERWEALPPPCPEADITTNSGTVTSPPRKSLGPLLSEGQCSEKMTGGMGGEAQGE